MLARPALYADGGGDGPGFRLRFSHLMPCPTVAGFQSAPLHRRPHCLSDKDSAPREGKASIVDGGEWGGQKGWFRKDDFGFVLTMVLCMAQRRRRWDGQAVATPRISITGDESNPSTEILFFPRKKSKMCGPCVCKINCMKKMKNKTSVIGFFRGHGPTSQPPTLFPRENPWRRHWKDGDGRYGALNKFM